MSKKTSINKNKLSYDNVDVNEINEYKQKNISFDSSS